MPDQTRAWIPTTATADDHTTADGVATSPDAPAGVGAAAGYDLHDPVGEGGMGVVYRARDRELGREVAVKVLAPKFGGRSRAAVRFVEEARITARLQHPGIPPVYRVGELPDGRPYLAMKLIRGRTLADLRASNTPLDRLGVFEATCRAVGYAHAHSVIHRDLKPGNVMVGAFGEVQVMDWGLAKVLPPSPPSGVGGEGEFSHPADAPPARGPDPLTQHGSVLGTPAFMAPEQATGAVDRIDRRTDVFGLGAILCFLLTGTPPYLGGSAESTRRLAADAKLADAFARLDTCGAEPDLVALCKRCLSADPTDRPADASEVTQAVTELRAAADDRARRAEIDREKAEVETREQRKRRRVWRVAAAVLLAGVVGTTVGLVLTRDAWAAERRRADGEARAKGAAELAHARTAAVLDAMTSEATGRSLASQKAVSPEQARFLAGALDHYRALAAAQGDDEPTRARTAEAGLRVAMIEYRLGRSREATAALRAACDGYQALAAAAPANAQVHQDLGLCHTNLGLLLARTGDRAGGLAHLRKGMDVRERLVAVFPTSGDHHRDLVESYVNLGRLLAETGKPDEAVALYRKGLPVLEQLTREYPAVDHYRQSLGKAHTDFGTVLAGTGQESAAREQFTRALAVSAKLAADSPDDPDTRNELAGCHINLGEFLRAGGDRRGALEQRRAAQAILEKLVAQFPLTPDYRIDLGRTYCDLGYAVQDGGTAAAGLEWFGKAVAVLTPVYQTAPSDQTGKYLRNSHGGRALAYDRLGRYADAATDWAAAVELSSGDEKRRTRGLRAVSCARAGMAVEAVAEADELTKSPDWSAGSWYRFAVIYAVASAKLPDKKAEHADRAVDLLRKAVKAGYKDAGQMKADPALAPLRDRADFQKLLAELEKKFPPKTEVLPAPRRVRGETVRGG